MPQPRRQPPAGTLQCFPSEINNKTWMGLYRSDGVHWIYLYEIRTEQCPIVRGNLTKLTAKVVAAYVTKNSLPVSEVSSLITNIHQALITTTDTTSAAPSAEKLSPAVPIAKSVKPDAILSLENGKPYKTLTRHLTNLGLTPETYREKWGLPSNYPMVAVNYAKRRSELAKELGLGRKPQSDAVAPQKSSRRRDKPDTTKKD